MAHGCLILIPLWFPDCFLIFNFIEYGFDISGGCDNQHVLGDNGIFITKIIPRGPAEDCGLLNVGDRILEVRQSILHIL